MNRASASNGVAVLFALEREAAPFRRAVRGRNDVSVHVSGIGRTRARRAAEQVLQESPALVIAAGFCGALSPSLQVADVVTSPRILTVDRLVGDPAEKRKLGELHDADAVDMESAAVAEACSVAKTPFLAVRTVSDTVDTALSPRLLKLLAGGNVSPLRAAAALVRQPALLGEFWRLARDTKRAAQALANALVLVLDSECPPVATGGLGRITRQPS